MHLEGAGHVLLYRTIPALAKGLKEVTIHFGMCVTRTSPGHDPVNWLFEFWFNLLIGSFTLILIVHNYLVRQTP
jgi:hypothetical protein